MGKFKKGLLLGSLLGAGLVWLNITKKGKAVRDDLLNHAAPVYLQLKEKLLKSKQWEKMKKNEYVKMVEQLMDKYAKQNKLAENVKQMVVKVLSSQWPALKDELRKKSVQ